MRIKNVCIKKIGEDDYSYSIPADYVIDEEANGVQLIGALDERLSGTTMNVVIARLDGLKIGQEITVQIESPL